jgi:hypothetical protein
VQATIAGMKHYTVLTFILLACEPKPTQETLTAIEKELVAACPITSAKDEEARDRCAESLSRSTLLADLMGQSILWGGYNPDHGDSYLPEDRSLTTFESHVFRRIYLSTFMFAPGGSSIETQGLIVLRVPAVFRNDLSAGSYPYPFWHSPEKWNAYQAATEVIFVFRDGELVAGYRSGKDPVRETVDRGPFDGEWRWFDEAGEEQPHVALFSYLLSPNNPHLVALDNAYRAFESEARMNTCETCHAPDNVSKMNPLWILNLPNQALAARHELLEVFRANAMPPGIGLDDETRRSMTELAEDFARIGDLALEYEREYYIQ